MGRSKVVYGGETLIDLTGDNISADKMFVGTTAHGADGEPIAGEFTLDAELSAQDALIAQIQTALQGKAAGGASENLDDVLSEQEALIARLQSLLLEKASGGNSDVEVSLLTRDITEYSNPTLTKLGAYAISGTKITMLDLPALDTIEGYAFYENTTLQHMTFPALQAIPYNGCRQWKGLVKGDFHVLKSIGSNGFYQATNLETLIIRTSSVCTIASGSVLTASKIINKEGYIYVPAALVDSYKAATNWSAYATQIRAIEDYPEICGG